ncbi:hypothetical protein PMAYCL1PPCAC_09391 [Pristionchus mayeri]|uniref:Uncharacterized protein n=1 Tax=Pristionchus mayeri TaxID=1317129 RepID=A0AAN4ZEB3_9BILA|nr:hypothetical protein PMAYCL1PPCAC_09391 [Pristionchus mayeri]
MEMLPPLTFEGFEEIAYIVGLNKGQIIFDGMIDEKYHKISAALPNGYYIASKSTDNLEAGENTKEA